MPSPHYPGLRDQLKAILVGYYDRNDWAAEIEDGYRALFYWIDCKCAEQIPEFRRVNVFSVPPQTEPRPIPGTVFKGYVERYVLHQEQYPDGLKVPIPAMDPRVVDELKVALRLIGGCEEQGLRTPLTDLEDPIAIIDIVKRLGRIAGRSDKLAEKMQRRGYSLVKSARKWYCQRKDAKALPEFSRYKHQIDKV